MIADVPIAIRIPNETEMNERQLVLSAADVATKTCPCCHASLEIISGHWLLRDCALCAWCRRWFALPRQEDAECCDFTITILPTKKELPS
jgi:hypothetical protein